MQGDGDLTKEEIVRIDTRLQHISGISYVEVLRQCPGSWIVLYDHPYRHKSAIIGKPVKGWKLELSAQHWATVGPQNFQVRSKVDELQREVQDLADYDITVRTRGHMTAVAPPNISCHHTVTNAVYTQHHCTVLIRFADLVFG